METSKKGAGSWVKMGEGGMETSRKGGGGEHTRVVELGVGRDGRGWD